MPYCPNCGTEFTEGNQFCPKCGRGLTTKQGAKRMSGKKKAGIIIGSIIGIPILIIIIVAIIQVITAPTYTLNVNVNPPGIASPTSEKHKSGTNVTVTANPVSGYAFDHWEGDASGTSPTITITMDSDKTLTASFRTISTPTQTYTLTIGISPSGTGSVSPSGGEYESGAQVTLTASPASGYTFDYWSGSASDTTSTITMTMDSDKSLTANFKTTPTSTPQIVIKFSATTANQIGRVFTAKPGYTYLILHLDIENNGYESFDTYEGYFYVVVNNVKYSNTPTGTENELEDVSLFSGGQTSGNIEFEVPQSVTSLSYQVGHSYLPRYNIKWVAQ
jgi:uncharacterized repeat protein (TIGR02543 family)